VPAHQIAHCLLVAVPFPAAYLPPTMAVFTDRRGRWVHDFYDSGPRRRRVHHTRAADQLAEAATAC